MHVSNPVLRAYLLGRLPDSEMREIDLRLISGEAISDELELAESELIEDHLEGVLTGEDAAAFQTHFLTSPARIQQIDHIAAIRKYAQSHESPGPKTESVAVRPSTFFSSFFGRWAVVGSAVALAVVAVLIFSQFYLRPAALPLEREYAELNSRDLGDVGSLAAYSTVNLISDSFRGGTTAAPLSGETLSDSVLFRLALPIDTTADTKFNAAIFRGDTQVFKVRALRSYGNPNGREVRLLLPRSQLTPGNYRIKLADDAGGSSSSFGFTVR